MAPEKCRRIRDLCARWVSVTNEGRVISGNSEQHRLLSNGIAFHELEHDELRAAAVGLCETLLTRGCTFTDLDHRFYWAWCAELTLGPRAILPLNEHDLRRLAAVTFRAALVRTSHPDPAMRQRAHEVEQELDLDSREFLMASHDVLAVIAFPFLEAVARRACGTFVTMAGEVLATFNRANGNPYTIGARCSNVGDLLRLLHTRVASAALKADLDEVLPRIATFSTSSQDGYKTVFEWRNSSLHGEASHALIGGTVLSLTTLILLDGLEAQYEAVRSWTRGHCRVFQSLEPRFRPGFSYYPPFRLLSLESGG